jgi:hypothetical protein
MMPCAARCPPGVPRREKLRIGVNLVNLFNAADSDIDYSRWSDLPCSRRFEGCSRRHSTAFQS